MMKRRMLLATLALGLMLAPAAQAQLKLNPAGASTEPLTGLGAAQWVQLATKLIDGSAVVGRPFIYILNGTGQELTAVVCDGKWQLVGPQPYNKDAPAKLKAWRATLVPTKGFDGYCKRSITAQSDDGVTYEAKLVSADGSFTNATFLTFMP